MLNTWSGISSFVPNERKRKPKGDMQGSTRHAGSAKRLDALVHVRLASIRFNSISTAYGDVHAVSGPWQAFFKEYDTLFPPTHHAPAIEETGVLGLPCPTSCTTDGNDRWFSKPPGDTHLPNGKRTPLVCRNMMVDGSQQSECSHKILDHMAAYYDRTKDQGDLKDILERRGLGNVSCRCSTI